MMKLIITDRLLGNKFPIVAYMIVSLLILLLLNAQGCVKKPVRPTLQKANGGKYYGGTYRINMLRGNPNGLDPVIITSKLADDIALQIYDRLITYDSNLVVQPELAKSWSISEDGLTYTFIIRSDVNFHNNQCFLNGKGRKMTSSDICYSLTRCCDPKAKTSAYWVFKNKVLGADEYFNARQTGKDTPTSVTGIIAPNDTTLIIKLIKPYSPFLLQLSNALGCVVPKEAVDYYGQDFFRNPVGTGAFTFVSWIDDVSMTLVRNPLYWKKDEFGNALPFLDTIVVSFIKDDKLQYQEFATGNLDESFTIPTELFASVMKSANNFQNSRNSYYIQQRPAMLTWFVDFLCSKPPFNNTDVRRAFSYAVDRERIVRFVLKNAPYQSGKYGITPPVMPDYDIRTIQGYDYQPAKARELMAKAGYPNGKNFPEIEFSIYPEPRLIQVAESMQQMFAEVLNVKVNIRIIQFAQLLQMAEEGKLQMWGTRWYGDYPDVENYLSLFDGTLVPTNPDELSYPNSTRYNNNDVNTLIQKAIETTDVESKMKLYQSAEQTMMNESPAIILFYENHYRLVQPWVKCYPLDAMNRVTLSQVWFGQ
jgi:oligopeptide transport system substrate-binding protein